MEISILMKQRQELIRRLRKIEPGQRNARMIERASVFQTS